MGENVSDYSFFKNHVKVSQKLKKSSFGSRHIIKKNKGKSIF